MHTVNTVAADDLVIEAATALAAMVLTKLAWNILVSAPQEFSHWALQKFSHWALRNSCYHFLYGFQYTVMINSLVPGRFEQKFR